MRARDSYCVLRAMALASVVWLPPAGASETSPAPSLAQQTAAESESEAVISYCLNIADKAKDARIARQMAALKEVEIRVEAKIEQLDRRRDELKSWVEKRRSLQDAAEKSLVDIYATMDAEAAAEQMTRLDSRLASSVLHQLKPRIASSILNEMQPDQAAILVKIIAAAGELEKAVK